MFSTCRKEAEDLFDTGYNEVTDSISIRAGYNTIHAPIPIKIAARNVIYYEGTISAWVGYNRMSGLR